MGKSVVSNIAFKSNLQYVKESVKRDSYFLASIHNPFALEQMKDLGIGTFTPIQEKEYRDASKHCAYAFEDDYPWGTIINAQGMPQVVCKCTKTNCPIFAKCRPDFEPSELRVADENAQFIDKISSVIKAMKTVPSKKHGNGEVVSSVLAGGAHKKNVGIPDESPVKVDDFGGKDSPKGGDSKPPTPGKADDPKPKIPPGPAKPKPKSLPSADMPRIKPVTGDNPQISFASFKTVEQAEIIGLDPTERTVVNAGPGTGKTWTLIEKIKYMLSEFDTSPEDILVLCFSRAAVEVIRNRLEIAAEHDELPLNWHEVDVRTFDSFATYLLSWAQENKPDILPDGFTLESANYDRRIEASIAAIQKFTDVLAEYKHVIVDEVQDLVGVRAELVLSLLETLPESCGFTILGDSCQSLYDYLDAKDSNTMSSTQFYKSVFQKYNTANFYSLDHNYRQGGEFGALTSGYRQSILTGGADMRAKEVKKLANSIETADIKLQHFSPQDAKAFTGKGTLGILTRSNGLALQISAWLRAEGVKHVLQKPYDSKNFAMWIANILLNTETDAIDQNEFKKLFGNYYPDRIQSADRYWNALISTQTDLTRRHFEIENLLRGLLGNARNPLLFEEPENNSADITISNIHRAKGREFDSVLVLNDLLEAITDENVDNVLEHKVCYVALTRPRKSIKKVELETQYIYSKNELHRCFKSGYSKFKEKNYLSHIEIGYDSDVDFRTYAENAKTQSSIKELEVGAGLKLKKCPEGTKSYVVYKIVPDEKEYITLGYTTAKFAKGLEEAMHRIFGHNYPIDYKYYANTFFGIYLDGLKTCVSSFGDGIPGAQKIGGMYIWYGMSISGFAQMEKDRY